jgi:cytoskeletal protein RodZ/LysM repeat protein
VEAVTEDNVRPLGEWLRQRREELGISLEQVEEDTRVRARFLEALEAEDLEGLPDPVVGRGLLRNYASYLELDPGEAARRYSGLAGPSELDSLPVDDSNPFESESFRPVPLHEIPYQRPRGWLLLGGLAIILLAAFAMLAWWNYPAIRQWFFGMMPTTQSSPAQQSTEMALATATQTSTPTTTATRAASAAASTVASAAAETPTQPTADLDLTITPTFTPSPPPTPTEPIYTGIFLELVFTDTSWIQVTVDGVRQFQGELEGGTYRSWYGEQRIELRAGNAGAVEATINGQRLGPLGGTAEVVDQVFEVVDNQVAAATPTRAPTLAPLEQTATAEAPTPTSTIAPTATLTPTSTLSLEIEPTDTSTPSSAAEAPVVALTPVTHIVKLGDSLYGLSLTYGTTVDAIKAANGLESNNLRVGQELVIPAGTITPFPTTTDTPEATPTPS